MRYLDLDNKQRRITDRIVIAQLKIRGITIPRVLFRSVDRENPNGAEVVRYAYINLCPTLWQRLKYAYHVLITGKLTACEIEKIEASGKFFTL